LAACPHLGGFALAVVFLLGLGLGPIFPTLISSASERYSEHSASITSLVVTAGAFAGITFPLIIGQVFSKFGHQLGMFVLALFSSILAAVFYTVQFRMPRPQSPEKGTDSATSPLKTGPAPQPKSPAVPEAESLPSLSQENLLALEPALKLAVEPSPV